MDSKGPSNFIVKEGDLLKATEQYIVHQTSCRVRRGLGLAKVIFDRFPHANVYKIKSQAWSVASVGKQHSRPGTIDVRGGTGGNGRGVINLMGQDHPGKRPEAWEDRQIYFTWGLTCIAEIEGLRSVAFPHGIGCGLAGGRWRNYEAMLRDFATRVAPVRVVIYKLPERELKAWPGTIQAQRASMKRKRCPGQAQKRKKKQRLNSKP